MMANPQASNSSTASSQQRGSGTDWRPIIRTAGLRATKQRLAVLDAVEGLPHGTVEELVDAVRVELPSITIQSVYVVMHSLVEAAIVRKVELPGSPARYELDTDDNHHHAVCRYCGRIDDVACVTGQAPCLHPNVPHDMTIEVAEVVYTAVCDECARTPQP